MSEQTRQMIAILFLIVSLMFLGYFFGKRVRDGKQKRKEAELAYYEKKERYSYLKPGIFDTCPREDVTAAALFHCMRKEEDDFDNYFENMNESEKLLYGIYQATSTIDGPHASLHSFFLSPVTEPYVKDIDTYFEKVGSHELADLMKAARRFAEIIENNEEDDEDDPEMGQYSRYNFSDFTNEFVTLVGSTNLSEKLIDFVLANKEDFYDKDIPEDLDEGENVDERTSNKI